MYLYPSRLVERLLRVRVVDSALSEFVSGFLTHVLMAIKEFSVFGILSPLNCLFFLLGTVFKNMEFRFLWLYD